MDFAKYESVIPSLSQIPIMNVVTGLRQTGRQEFALFGSGW